ncbi:L-threonylcarbamoyladenylate synthase [Consotaella salsifontis]|nr:L-threonylcarbamoyladenylate synthase [Consotaella salsifontis]
MTRTISAGPTAVAEAASSLTAGNLVAIPTETVYGLAADATNGAAVAAIFEAKGRPHFNPLISHVDSLAMARRIVVFDEVATLLAERYWPGPLTLVLPARPEAAVHPLVSGGLSTLAVRAPRGIAAEIITALGRPVAAPSANPSGRVSPTTAAHVVHGLSGRIDLVVDGGPCSVGLESTIVAPEVGRIALLRAGAITAEEIAALTGLPVVRPDENEAIRAPGQMKSHYAPAGAVRLEARSVRPGDHLIKFGGAVLEGEEGAAAVIDLSPAGDLREAAANLFAALSAFDRSDIARIAVSPIPQSGLGEAINDRLRRAAAPRQDASTSAVGSARA